MDRHKALEMIRDHVREYHRSVDAVEMAVHASEVLFLFEMMDANHAFDSLEARPPIPRRPARMGEPS